MRAARGYGAGSADGALASSVVAPGPLTVNLLGVSLPILTRRDALAAVEGLYGGSGPSRLFYVNAHTLNLAVEDQEFAGVLRRGDLLLNDGVGVSWAARVAGFRFIHNLEGSDFNPLILDLAAQRGWKVFFLGGRPGVTEVAAENLTRRFPELRVVGTAHGYLDEAESTWVTGEVKQSGAEVLMVGMGSPLQEMWMEEHLEASGVRLGIAVGGFFDFESGRVPRAPRWMNRAGLEWSYRLAVEPRRLWRRYLVGNPRFIARVVSHRYSRNGSLPAAPE